MSERKNKKNCPIFDLPKGNWCSIERSKNNKWLILFYKYWDENCKNSICYISFAKSNEISFSFFFKNFSEVFKDENSGQWLIKKKKNDN